jgi:hypothetical protein
MLRLLVEWSRQWGQLAEKDREEWLRRHPNATVDGTIHTELAINAIHLVGPVQEFMKATLPVPKKVKDTKGKAGTPWTYNTFLDAFRAMLTGAGLAAKDFATHSLRRGGASQLREAGVSDELIMDQGRWKSRSSMNRYFDWDTELSVRASRLLREAPTAATDVTQAPTGERTSDALEPVEEPPEDTGEDVEVQLKADEEEAAVRGVVM